MTLADFFSVENPVQEPLWLDLEAMIKHKYSNTPRHLQVELGPSEVAHPCMRKMAFATMQTPRCNPEYDPLPSITGTAMHTWLEDAARMANEALGRERWLIETRVTVTAGLSGSSDLFDTDSGTVVDWKNPGQTSFLAQVKQVDETYRGQLHLYGRGFQNAGHVVKEVAIALLPRAGTLSKMHLWHEPYDDDRAQRILDRREATLCMINDLDVDVYPNRYQWIPASPGHCSFCEFWNPNANASNPFQCKGDGS